MSNAIEDLGKDMVAQMKQVIMRNSGVTVELGTIGRNMSLSVTSLKNAIPTGDYMVSLHLAQASLQLSTSIEESPDRHNHTINLPAKLRGIQAGDRVVVAWVGTEPIVVDIVVSS